GEYVAACLAGVFTLEEALPLVAARGRLMQELPAGAMLSVALPAAELLPLLGEELALAAVNAPGLAVAAGPEEAVAGLAARLAAAGVEVRRLHTSHAFHSRMMEPALAAFAREVGRVCFQPPSIPFLSNLTGTWITPAEATDPGYWVRHLRQTVRFSDGVLELLRAPDRVLLEVGPGRTLSSLVRRHGSPPAAGAAEPAVVQSLPHPGDPRPETAFLLGALGRLWLAGVTVGWEGFHRGERRLRVPLPTHPFERQRYWLDPPLREGHERMPAGPAGAWSAPAEEGAAVVQASSQETVQRQLRHPRPDLETPYLAPRGAVEEGLAGLWEEVLGIAGVGVHDDFFELGGHSLMATQLASRIRDRFGLEVPLDALFEAATVARLAPRLTGIAAVGGTIRPQPRRGPVALSFAQQRLWFLDRLEPESPWYNLAFAVRFEGRLYLPALERALAAVAGRHESLRTTFELRDGEPLQVIVAPSPVPLPLADLAGLPAPLSGAEARRLAVEEARRPFDLARGPLCRARLLRMAGADHLALLTLHHIVADGWSMGVMVRELGVFYERWTAGTGEPLPALPIQYADFAVWQRAELPAVLEKTLLPYWRERLGGSLPVLELPTDRPRPPVQTFRGARSPIALPAPLVVRLRALARERGATLFMALMAGFKALLLRSTEETDVLVGIPIANRNRSEIEGLIGLFVNTLVLRTDLSGDPGFAELLGRVREGTLGAYAHQDLPFEKLVEELQPRRDLARSPLFQVMLGLESAPPAPWRVPDLAATPLEVDLGAARFEHTLFLAETALGGIAGHLEYNRDLFDRTTAARLIDHLGNLLAGAAEAPGTPLSRLPLLAPAESWQLLGEWNATARPAPQGTTPERILARAAERPDATALACGEERVSYGELAARAGRLARHLRSLGVGPEVLVGIATLRSPAMVVGLLGIWLAGGAYLPLDPAYPPERLALMLADSGAPVLLTEERLLPILPPHAARTVCLDRDWPEISRAAAGPDLRAPAAPAGLAYVLYTSGSTGRPKGV
ncbi:MAG: hypothetical protein QOJ16_402, partial [Acidobacteriota bacterium]|nr:hypothetical protein [Acidobacteriota bacterium]